MRGTGGEDLKDNTVIYSKYGENERIPLCNKEITAKQLKITSRSPLLGVYASESWSWATNTCIGFSEKKNEVVVREGRGRGANETVLFYKNLKNQKNF